MAIHVDLSASQLDGLLSKEPLEKAMDARMRLEYALSAAILNLRGQGCSHVHIVRWQEREADVFRWLGQIFKPGEEQEAAALAAEKQGEIEIVEFREPPEIDIVYPWQELCGDPTDGKA